MKMTKNIKAMLENGMYFRAPILKAEVFFGASKKEKAVFSFEDDKFLKEVQRINRRMKMG
jgi:hypothetical protein